jgi:hypothetical protein
MTLTLAGIKMLFNAVPENAPFPIRGHCVSFSNRIDSSDFQLEKHSSLVTSTLSGMKMPFNPLDENALHLIYRILEPFSNTTNFIDLQFPMNDWLTISTENGIHRQSQIS